MVNASFVFGMDDDGLTCLTVRSTGRFATVDADRLHAPRRVETATFHILTPYHGTTFYKRVQAGTSDWDRDDTRHVVFEPARLTPAGNV
jgi:hypothetical protein